MILDIIFDQAPAVLQADFAGEQTLTIDFGEILAVPDSDWYEGMYSVTPSVAGTMLPTAQKRMHNDVTVRPIPYSSVSRPSGISRGQKALAWTAWPGNRRQSG